MAMSEEEALRLLRDVRREKMMLETIEHHLLATYGVRVQKAADVRAVEWLLAALIEKPVARLVDAILKRLDRWRSRRNP